MTDPLGQSQVIPYLKGLRANGHKIWLISYEKTDRYINHKDEISSLLEENDINWLPMKYTSKPPVLSTIYDIYRLSKIAETVCDRSKINVIHCRGYISSIVGLKLKRKYGVKFLFDMRGFFADERKEGGLWNTSNIIFRKVYNYFKHKELQFFSEADYTISLTEAGKKIIHNMEGVDNNPVPIKVIPCCADLDHFSETKINASLQTELKERFKIEEGDFVLSYLGSVGTWYMLDEMLDFFKELKKDIPRSKFLFITGDDKEMIHSSAKSRDVDTEDIIVEKASRNEVPTYLSLSNTSIFFIKPVFSKQASSPTKMGELMSMGIPLVCNKGVGDVDAIMEDSKAGYMVHDFTKGEYAAAVEYLKNMDEFYNKETARDAAEKYYSLDKGIKLYCSVYDELAN